jgi:hypothetical protein
MANCTREKCTSYDTSCDWYCKQGVRGSIASLCISKGYSFYKEKVIEKPKLNLKEMYKAETGEEAEEIIHDNWFYDRGYVHWLENKIQELMK